jgi:hypothetical protein
VVKKTAIKTPKEIELEKKVSRLEDDIDGLKGWQAEMNSFLADLWPKDRPAAGSGKAPDPPAVPTVPTPKEGFWNELNRSLGLED